MRKPSFHLITLIAMLALGAVSVFAQTTLVCEGVLGNSGEQGKSLVRFTANTGGIGVVYDRFGSLWDRAGTETLNRYAPDGRLLAQYNLPREVGRDDQIALTGDHVVVRLNGKLYAIPVDAPTGTPAKSLNFSGLMSFGSSNGRVAVYRGSDVSLLDPATGEVTAVLTGMTGVTMVEIAQDGTLFVGVGNKIRKFVNGKEVTEGWPKSIPGERPQYLDGNWYSHAWHGTIKRFDANGQPAPGVVLGGSSGSFIGKLDGNYELMGGRGMAKLADGLFAVSGAEGVMHLLRWSDTINQFEIIRRIGALASCRGIALDRQGNIWTQPGVWHWNDGPDAPLQLGAANTLLYSQAVMLENDTMVGVSLVYGSRPALVTGVLTTYPKNNELGSDSPIGKDTVGATVYTGSDKQLRFLGVTKSGKAYAVTIDGSGNPRGKPYPVELQTTAPLKEWTTLAMRGTDVLLAAADGALIEFTRDGENWKENRRTTFWGEKPDEKMGGKIYISTDAGRMWISDRERHRVLCFDYTAGKLLASFGTLDQAGDDLNSLRNPEAITARGNRAIVYDSGNQRLVKLSLK